MKYILSKLNSLPTKAKIMIGAVVLFVITVVVVEAVT